MEWKLQLDPLELASLERLEVDQDPSDEWLSSLSPTSASLRSNRVGWWVNFDGESVEM